MGQQSNPKGGVSKLRRGCASILLAAALVQIGMFFVGLSVPLGRLTGLWGKTFEERQAMFWPAGRALSQVAEQLPLDAKVYIEDPQGSYKWVYRHAFYYFYPRYTTISMTDRYYEDDEAFAKWDEYPDEAWLVSNKFTHVVSFKNGIHISPVASSLPTPNATTQ
jgi:hypothetical protein